MRIGELADRVGVNPKTVRYYEGIGLLPHPERLASGYRDYTDDDVERLRFVKAARRLGLSLSEISEILTLRERGERPCEYVLGVIDRQVADIDRRLEAMAELRQQLVDLKGAAELVSSDPACYCGLIERGP